MGKIKWEIKFSSPNCIASVNITLKILLLIWHGQEFLNIQQMFEIVSLFLKHGFFLNQTIQEVL